MKRFVLLLVLLVVFATLTSTVYAASAVIDFSGLAEGQVITSVSSGAGISGAAISGAVGVRAEKPDSPGVNRAMIFDATCTGGCTGGDFDLFQADLGNVLIISDNLNAASPNDSLVGGTMWFDFTSFGPGAVTVKTLVLLDTEESGGYVQVYGANPGIIPIPVIANGTRQTIAVNRAGVTGLRIFLAGSGAVDNISLETPDQPRGDEGCTPGYWKNHLRAWAATGYSPNADFDATFGVNLFNPNVTLQQALNQGGGGKYRLGRHGTAALLSAAHPGVDYPYTVAEVIALVQAGNADALERANELGCPL